MRLEALRMMRILAGLPTPAHRQHHDRPRPPGSDIDLHVFSDSVESVAAVSTSRDSPTRSERKQVRKHGEERIFVHIHVNDRFPFELTIYAGDKAHYVFKSSITGKAIERASIAELEQLLAREYPEASARAVGPGGREPGRPLPDLPRSCCCRWRTSRKARSIIPKATPLYHSLQVFDLARDELPYDEEFLLAALLHDVGKAIDRHDHVTAGLEALAEHITPRTAWFIAHHMEGQELLDGSLGVRARRRLEASEDYEELKLLARCDRNGRQRGVETPELEEAIEYLRELAETCGE